MCDYQESVTRTDKQADRQTPDKDLVIPMCRYTSQATQKRENEWRHPGQQRYDWGQPEANTEATDTIQQNGDENE